MFRSFNKKRLAVITIVYWFLLCYIVAALAWWYIELWKLNERLFETRKGLLVTTSESYQNQLSVLENERSRKKGQFAGEGITFLAVTLVAAVFVYRSVRKQIALTLQQQNFLMAVTHELKTPIAVTKLNLETLKRHKLDPAHVERIITNTIQETNRLNDLCNNILLSSQLEVGSSQLNNEPVYIDQLTEKAANEFAQRFPRRSLVKQIESRKITVIGDELMLRMAINNLIENAFKYSRPEDAVTIRLFEQGLFCKIEVADTGPGIPESEKKKVFQKFYRIGDEHTRSTKGTGLGLYLTKKIVEDHGGSVQIRDNQPRGVVFTIGLPKS